MLNTSKVLICLGFVFFFGTSFLKSNRTYSALPKAKCSQQLEMKLSDSYVRGKKYCVPKALREQHRDLGLFHLMTPSGLHLSSLLLLLFPLKFLGSSRILFLMSALIIWCHVQGLNGLYSLKRMSTLHLTSLLMPKLTRRWLLLITLLLEFIGGSFTQSPLSFSLSTMFLIIIFESKNNVQRLTSFFLAQMLISYVFKQSFFPIGSLLGFILTSIFTFIFPVIAVENFLHTNFLSSTTLHYFLVIIKFFHELSQWTGSLPLPALTPLYICIAVLRFRYLCWSLLILC